MIVQKKPEPAPVYRVKVTLDGIKPPIWRIIQVRGMYLYFKLRKIIRTAMGWEDDHLHQFIIGEDYYAISSPEDPWPWRQRMRDELSSLRVILMKNNPSQWQAYS